MGRRVASGHAHAGLFRVFGSRFPKREGVIMMVRKNIAAAAALAALACGSAAFAAQPAKSADLSLSPVTLDASGPTTLTPTMYWLDGTSFGKSMEAANISITGYVEGGYFYDTNAPRLAQQEPTLVAFPGPFSNRGLLDQADVTIQKKIDATKSWDWGFLFEGGYGTDYTFIHSSGLLDNRAGAAKNSGHPQNQVDIVQGDVSLLVPVGSGLTLTAGKFVGLLSLEVINPTGNAFYTHSYNFTYGVPATNTGVTASYTFAKAWNGNDVTVLGGITRGWNQTFRDGNGEIDGIAQISTNLNDKTHLVLNAEEGPEGNDPAHTNIGPFNEGSSEASGNSGNYWTTLEAILTYTASDQLTLTGDFLYNDIPHADGIVDGKNCQWYGAALYAGYKLNSNFTLNGRAEWYRDQNGFSTGTQANYYEATAGVQIHPLPNDNIFQWLQIRPEVRYDYADKPAFNFSHEGGRGDNDEFTVACDAIMQF
jgi:hypothetical protein